MLSPFPLHSVNDLTPENGSSLNVDDVLNHTGGRHGKKAPITGNRLHETAGSGVALCLGRHLFLPGVSVVLNRGGERGVGDVSKMEEVNMIQAEERVDVRPMCPHCKMELNTVWFQELEGFLGKRYMYFCPNCRSILGVSHRKGFWMG